MLKNRCHLTGTVRQCIQVGEQFYPEQTNGASQAAENMFHHQGETHTGMVEILSAFTHSHVCPLKLLLCPKCFVSLCLGSV